MKQLRSLVGGIGMESLMKRCEMKGDWPGEQTQEAFRINRAVELYDLYKDSSSSDRTHSTRKLLKLFLDKVNMDYTGLKFNLVETWKKYFNMA